MRERRAWRALRGVRVYQRSCPFQNDLAMNGNPLFNQGYYVNLLIAEKKGLTSSECEHGYSAALSGFCCILYN